MSDDAGFRDLAWECARRQRCCPPPALLEATNRAEEVARHLANCELCREPDVAQVEARLEALVARSLAPDETAAATREPQIGDVMALASSLAAWGPKDRYYNPPVVLILRIPTSAAVHVAQVFGHAELRASDDVLLGGDFDGFAEPWNTYTLRRSDLAAHIGSVGEEVVAAVSAAEAKGTEVQPDSVITGFRQMEVEVGAFFSIAAVAALLAQYERAASTADRDSEEVRAFESRRTGVETEEWLKRALLELERDEVDVLAAGAHQPALVLAAGRSAEIVADLGWDGQVVLAREANGVLRVRFDAPDQRSTSGSGPAGDDPTYPFHSGAAGTQSEAMSRLTSGPHDAADGPRMRSESTIPGAPGPAATRAGRRHRSRLSSVYIAVSDAAGYPIKFSLGQGPRSASQRLDVGTHYVLTPAATSSALDFERLHLLVLVSRNA